MDIIKKINLTNKVFIGIFLLVAPHMAIILYLLTHLSNIETKISMTYFLIISIILIFYIYLKINIIPHGKK